ncbi:hypothetical protein WDW86_12620 [Bdellovibrionota bacterium FG-2]
MSIENEKYPQPKNAFRIDLTFTSARPRLDQALLEALRKQDRNLDLRSISRSAFKELFKQRRIKIKGQNALPASGLASGTTTVDILGFEVS